jgi:hypothetical protein
VMPVAIGCHKPTISPYSSKFHVIDLWRLEYAHNPLFIGFF